MRKLKVGDSRMATLHKQAPDLADCVEESRLTLDEALVILHNRTRRVAWRRKLWAQAWK
jgi:hypothetical protein